jgi:hypothetical protein
MLSDKVTGVYLVNVYQTAWCHNREDHSLNLHFPENIKLHVEFCNVSLGVFFSFFFTNCLSFLSFEISNENVYGFLYFSQKCHFLSV